MGRSGILLPCRWSLWKTQLMRNPFSRRTAEACLLTKGTLTLLTVRRPSLHSLTRLAITKAGLDPGLALKPDRLSAHCCACLLLAWGHVQVP